MTRDAGLAVLLGGAGEGEDFVDLHAFGLLDRTCTPELVFKSTYEILARAIHQEYIKHMEDEGFNARTKPSIAPWDELLEDQRDSNRAAAEHISVKLKAVGCDIALTNDWQVAPFQFSAEEVELMARMEHDRWLKNQLHLGWRYGLNRDDQARIHPCLVGWDELPEKEKEKDRVTVWSIPKFLIGVGFKIYRLG